MRSDRCSSVEFEQNKKQGFQTLRFLKVLLVVEAESIGSINYDLKSA